MNITIPVHYIRKFLEKHPHEDIEDKLRYVYDDRQQTFPIDSLTDPELDTLVDILSSDEKLSFAVTKKINTLKGIRKNPGGRRCKRLEDLASAMKSYLKDASNHWLMEDDGGGCFNPAFITNIEYHPPVAREERPAYVTLELGYMYRGDRRKDTHHWNRSDIGAEGSTVPELLEEKALFIPTEDHLSAYKKSMEKYAALQSQTGEQFLATGEGRTVGNRWERRNNAMVLEGVPVKLVMDDIHEEGEEFSKDNPTVSDLFWDDAKGEEGHSVNLPIQPYVKMFDLERHEFVILHIDQVQPYKWDPSLGDKLILPKEHKEVIQILMETASEEIDDIIKGKSGGTIVICTGEPGTGKTLTAEVTSEVVKRPLYKVNCSQLGTDEESIEKELSEVLNRASRWKALLLIDEADVYVRTRENDIQQNAIVGVFLRVLEYYRGVLFLTSNRATVIDDAIMSRSTVHLKYQKPTKEELISIWTVLSRQFSLEFGLDFIHKLVAAFPNIVGRDVKNLLKIVKRYNKRNGGKIDLALFKQMAVHKDINV